MAFDFTADLQRLRRKPLFMPLNGPCSGRGGDDGRLVRQDAKLRGKGIAMAFTLVRADAIYSVPFASPPLKYMLRNRIPGMLRVQEVTERGMPNL
jgi:hypothetical protein